VSYRASFAEDYRVAILGLRLVRGAVGSFSEVPPDVKDETSEITQNIVEVAQDHVEVAQDAVASVSAHAESDDQVSETTETTETSIETDQTSETSEEATQVEASEADTDLLDPVSPQEFAPPEMSIPVGEPTMPASEISTQSSVDQNDHEEVED
jgi:hypothetical protein